MFEATNLELFRWINDFGRDYPATDPISIFLAEKSFLLIILALLFFWFIGKKQENRMLVITSVVAFVTAIVVGKLSGLLYSHNQPFFVLPHVNQLISHDIDNSFPSDHTLTFFSILTTFWLFHVRFRWLWLILAFLVAISRVIVGVHYPVDIFFGAIIGIICAVIAYKFVPKQPLTRKVLALYTQIENRILPSGKH